MVLGGLMPDRLGLRLDAALCAEYGHSAVQHAQGALNLNGEIDVAGSVDQVDLMTAPFTGRCSRGDGDAALLLLLHPVHRRHTFVGLANAMGTAGVIQDAFGRSRLAGVNVGHDADVAYVIK